MRASEVDQRMMLRALREARKGRPSPNPHVGAVIARGDELIAVGHHARCGGPHAEVAAIARAGARSRGATLYVTFEPCNHHGRTGPCTEAILAAGITRVVVACEDPAPHVPGAGKRLRRAGVAVQYGLFRAQGRALIEDFTKYMCQGLPYVTLKAAVTLDGRIAGRDGDSQWITSLQARREAHRMRARADAALVGVATVLADDPQLNVRLTRGPQPRRAVLDSRLRTPAHAAVLRPHGGPPTLLFHGPRASRAARRRLVAAGAELVELPLDASGRPRLRSVLRELAKREVMLLLVEGGAQVHGAFIDAGLADRAAIFVAPRILGDAAATPLAAGRKKRSLSQALSLEDAAIRRLGPDVLFSGRLRAPTPAQKPRGRKAR